jgi:hypothetical protein
MEGVCFEVALVVDSVGVGEFAVALFEVVAEHPFETGVVVVGLDGEGAARVGLSALKGWVLRPRLVLGFAQTEAEEVVAVLDDL